MGKGLRTHRNLDVWKEAMQLAREVYRMTSSFPKGEIYGLTAQMRRAAVSVPSNIAEGAARGSNREFTHFLYVALGSLAELETQWLLAQDLRFTHNDTLSPQIDRVRRMLVGLIDAVRGRQ